MSCGARAQALLDARPANAKTGIEARSLTLQQFYKDIDVIRADDQQGSGTRNLNDAAPRSQANQTRHRTASQASEKKRDATTQAEDECNEEAMF